MLEFLYFLFAFLVGAIGRRIQGGVFIYWTKIDIGTQGSRSFWAILNMIILMIGGVSFYQSLIFGIGIWAGSCFGFNNSLALGHVIVDNKMVVDKKKYWRDFFFLTLHGVIGTLPAVITAFVLGFNLWWIMILSGLLSGPTYALGYLLIPYWHPVWLEAYYDASNNNCDAVPLGELLYGAAVGVGFAALALGGIGTPLF